MNMRDQGVLLRAGYSLFRRDLTNRIWKCSKPGGWKVHSRHESHKAMTRTWNELMRDEKNLAG